MTSRDLADSITLRIGLTGFAMGVRLMHQNFHNFMDANDLAAILAQEHAEAVDEAGVQLGEALVRVSTPLLRAVCLVAFMHSHHPHILYAIPMYLNGTVVYNSWTLASTFFATLRCGLSWKLQAGMTTMS